MAALKLSIQILLAILYTQVSWGQSTINNNQEDFIENFIQSIESEGEFDFINLFDELNYIYEHPLDINTATYDDFKKLYILNDIQIADIIDHRSKYGDFIEIYELQSIPSLSLPELKNIQAFLTTDNSTAAYMPINEMISESSNTLYVKWRRIIEEQKGYTDESSENSRYLGDPNRLYLRYQMRFADKLRVGLNMEKDEGEPFLNNVKKDFDFYSAHVHLRDYTPKLKDLVIGDYSVSLGQGLILHNNFGTGKSSYVMDIKKGGRAIKSYSSINEVNFYRGAAATYLMHDDFTITAFVSKKDIDATSSPVPNDDGFDFFSSVINNGYHRSITERNKINTVNELALGSRLRYQSNNLSLGFNFLYTQFDQVFQRRSRLYNRFLFAGERLINQSIDYSYRYRNFNLFGEAAMSDNNSLAQVHGLLVGLNKYADLSVLYRKYDPSYQSLFSNSFGERNTTNNEQGLYMGVVLKPSNRFTISAYADHWKNPWVQFRTDSPARGKEYLIRFNYLIRKKANFYVQYKYEQKEQNISGNDLKIDQTIPFDLEKFRAHASYKLDQNWELRSRVELSRYLEGSQDDFGYMVYQDVIYKPKLSKFSFNGRIAYFNTEGFDTRIYAYESDLTYEYFVPFFADNGWRYYANLKYYYNRNITFELRAAQTNYLDRLSIGSSGNEIDGSTQTQVKAQAKISF